MSRSITSLTCGLCLVTGLAFVQPSNADPSALPAIGSAAGAVTSFDPVIGMEIAVVTGHGSILGKHANRITTFLDFNTGTAWGTFEITAAEEATSVLGSFTASFQPIEGTPWIEFLLHGTFEGGTGRLDGASGHVEVVALQNLETGEVEYEYCGKFEFDE